MALFCPGMCVPLLDTDPFIPYAEKYHSPMVVSGFEVNDVLVSIYYLLHQLFEGVAKVENTYDRVVKPEGNVKVQNISPLFLNNETQYGAVSECTSKRTFLTPRISAI